jgi:2'-5' RNA ligase
MTWFLSVVFCGLVQFGSRDALAREALPGLPLSARVLDSRKVPFVKHEGLGDFDNWLAVNIPWEPINSFRGVLEKEGNAPLLHRGEAHITVLTPVEWQSLKKVLSMKELHQLFQKRIQRVPYQVSCLGKFTKEMEGKTQSAFFLVVQSPGLFDVRQEISKLFAKKGGDPERFDPLEYFPHITVGFSEKDFHLSDGAIKDLRSCDRSVLIR